ncbi:MAG: hypothetical protein V1743_01335 [Nanoarchaeota archaeon]
MGDQMVNINMKIPDEMHRQLKLASVIKDETLKDHIIELLEEYAKDSSELKKLGLKAQHR